MQTLVFIHIENNKKIAQKAKIVLRRKFLSVSGLTIKIPRRGQALVHLPAPLVITYANAGSLL